MAPIKFERIVSASSEDPDFPADNLLKTAYSDKKWKCRSPGEKQISVVIQLEKAVKITAVDVGNYGAAFVEILVSKLSNPEEYKVLVVASSLMTLQEAKLGTNLSNVRFFKEENLDKEVASEKWDRIKAVCSQPYNKLIQFGLSFLVVHTASSPDTQKPVTSLENFKLKKTSQSDDLGTGSLFAKRKITENREIKGTAAIRIASTSGILERKVSPNITLGANDKKGNSPHNSESELRKKNKDRKQVQSPSTSKKAQVNGNSSRDVPPDRSSKREPRKAKARVEKPFNKLLEGVVVALSGFVNPYRGVLRGKALDLGAKYRPDWDSNCTHLICAFPNTPKYNQVLGHGKIVTKDWIETCHSRRMRLPWRRFALHPPDKAGAESEEEIWEARRDPSPVAAAGPQSASSGGRADPSPAASSGGRADPGPAASSSGEDTEEEIEKVLKRQKQLANTRAKLEKVVSSSPNDDMSVDEEEGAEGGASGPGPMEEGTSPPRDPGSPSRPSQSSLEKPLLKKSPLKNDSLKKFIKSEKSPTKLSKKERPSKTATPQKKGYSRDGWSPAMRKQLKLPPALPISSEDTYGMETEEEDDSSDSKKFDLPHLPAFLEGVTFLIGTDLTEEEAKEILRYILAHKGSIAEKENWRPTEVKYLITKSVDELKKVQAVDGAVRGVRPDWLWKAHDEARIPPPASPFTVS